MIQTQARNSEFRAALGGKRASAYQVQVNDENPFQQARQKKKKESTHAVEVNRWGGVGVGVAEESESTVKGKG